MSRRPAASEVLAWSLVGAAVGVAAGFVLGEWLGPVSRERATQAFRRATTPDAIPLTPAEAARAVRLTVERDTLLKGLDLVPIGVGRGVVELHGWVPTRALRARAARLAGSTPGIDSLVNCLLVHGEDDAAEPALDANDLLA
jgi:hypothetical protein